MNRARNVGPVFGFALLASACTPPPLAAHLPSTAVDCPWSHLSVGWDPPQAARLLPPPAVVVPADQLARTLDHWAPTYFCNWPVTLADGRSAVVNVYPDHGQPHAAMVSVYRPDGSLELQETQLADGRPNAPRRCVYFGPDGRTQRMVLDATHPNWTRICLYDGRGALARVLDAQDGVIYVETAVAADGTLTGVNGSPNCYVGRPHPSAATRPFAFAVGLR